VSTATIESTLAENQKVICKKHAFERFPNYFQEYLENENHDSHRSNKNNAMKNELSDKHSHDESGEHTNSANPGKQFHHLHSFKQTLKNHMANTNNNNQRQNNINEGNGIDLLLSLEEIKRMSLIEIEREYYSIRLEYEANKIKYLKNNIDNILQVNKIKKGLHAELVKLAGEQIPELTKTLSTGKVQANLATKWTEEIFNIIKNDIEQSLKILTIDIDEEIRVAINEVTLKYQTALDRHIENVTSKMNSTQE
jgi:hypothetical protein